MFSRTDYILPYKTMCNTFKKIKILLSIVSNQNGMKQNKTKKMNFKKVGKITNM